MSELAKRIWADDPPPESITLVDAGASGVTPEHLQAILDLATEGDWDAVQAVLDAAGEEAEPHVEVSAFTGPARGAKRYAEGDWEEGKHPRDKGRFASKAGSGAAGKDAPEAKKDAPPATPADKPARAKAPASKAKVAIAGGADAKKTERLATKLLGKGALDKIPSVVGAPDDATVKVYPDKGGYHLWVEVDHPAFNQTMKRRISHDGKQAYIKNDLIDIKKSARGSGLGAEIFARQVEWAREHGIGYIECHAAKNDASGSPYFNGYYTWPRLGYDAYLDQEGDYEHPGDEAKAKEAMAKFGAETVQEVMATPEGRAWWKANGYGLTTAKFKLEPGSRSSAVHDAYLDELAAKKAPPAAQAHAEPANNEAAEEIDLSPEQEEALERAWQRLDEETSEE
jgi:GNAT superfamily N-acetyltransferase